LSVEAKLEVCVQTSSKKNTKGIKTNADAALDADFAKTKKSNKQGFKKIYLIPCFFC
jgi:hypothetical protein